jgi:hypothetical protein
VDALWRALVGFGVGHWQELEGRMVARCTYVYSFINKLIYIFIYYIQR